MRSERRRSKSIRCSQSTAMVAPREAMLVIDPFPLPMDPSGVRSAADCNQG
jgi:hypothetical protein